jgi:NCAIR mutase (PurE)-related protein
MNRERMKVGHVVNPSPVLLPGAALPGEHATTVSERHHKTCMYDTAVAGIVRALSPKRQHKDRGCACLFVLHVLKGILVCAGAN